MNNDKKWQDNTLKVLCADLKNWHMKQTGMHGKRAE